MRISNRQQWLAVLAGVVVALFIGDRLILSPVTSAWKSRNARLAQLRKKVDEGHTLLNRETSLRARWEYMRTNALPQNASAAEQRMLRAFDTWSQRSRVSIMSISPQWKREENFSTLECRVEAAGTLAALSRFIYDLERDPMALRIHAVELSARDTQGQQLALGLQVSGLSFAAVERGQP